MTAQSSENQELKAIPSVIRYFRAGNLETKNEIKEAVREFSLGSFSLFLISIDAKYVYNRPLLSLTLYVNPSVDWMVPRTYSLIRIHLFAYRKRTLFGRGKELIYIIFRLIGKL